MAVQEIKHPDNELAQSVWERKDKQIIVIFKALSRHPLYLTLPAQVLHWLPAGLVASRLPSAASPGAAFGGYAAAAGGILGVTTLKIV